MAVGGSEGGLVHGTPFVLSSDFPKVVRTCALIDGQPGRGGVLMSRIAAVLDPLIFTFLQCRDGALRAPSRQTSRACTKREAP